MTLSSGMIPMELFYDRLGGTACAFASLPHAKLSKADQKKLGAILKDVGSDANVDDFTAVLRRATPALARWTPSLLGQAIRRTYFSLPQRTGPDAGRLVHQLADVSLVLSDRERDHLLERGFDELGKLAPDDTAQSKNLAAPVNR